MSTIYIHRLGVLLSIYVLKIILPDFGYDKSTDFTCQKEGWRFIKCSCFWFSSSYRYILIFKNICKNVFVGIALMMI